MVVLVDVPVLTGTSGDAGDADAGEGSGSDSESSEWPHSEADDH